MHVFYLILVLFGVYGCSDDWAEPTGERVPWELLLDPPTPPNEAQPVLAITLKGAPGAALPGDAILLEGKPSRISTSKYLEGEVTEALAERIVPTLSDRRSGELTIRPRSSLAVGQHYTLLARSGVLAELDVRPSYQLEYLTRVWPPRESTENCVQVLYCANTVPRELGAIELFPPETYGVLASGLDPAGHDMEHCVRISLDGSEEKLVQPPSHWQGFAFEPSPITAGLVSPEAAPLECDSPTESLGPGCFRVEGDYGVIVNSTGTKLWVLKSAYGWHSSITEGGGIVEFPLPNEDVSELEAIVYDLAGRSTFDFIGVPPRTPVPHVVITEVLSNPLGPEPDEEWVELANSGSAIATMQGWKLRDPSGEVEIPSLVLEPGAIVLLARSDFHGGVDGDVPPAKGVTIVRLSSLGKNGLANGGEALSLVDASGGVVSVFPARPSDIEGVSIARRSLGGYDDSPTSFGPHASPGASPGQSNVVE